VEAVASGNEVALEFLLNVLFAEANCGMVGGEVVDGDSISLEDDLASRRKASFDEVLDHFVLGIDGDAGAGEIFEVNPMTASVETQLNAIVNEAFAFHTLADPDLDEQVGSALFEDPGPDALFAILARPRLKHDGVNAAKVQKLREQ
jgi:hypothetical protein